MFAPLPFGPDEAVYLNGLVVGGLVIALTVLIPGMPGISGIDGADYPTNETVFDLDELRAAAVRSGGAIGCELGQALASLGATFKRRAASRRSFFIESRGQRARPAGVARDQDRGRGPCLKAGHLTRGSAAGS